MAEWTERAFDGVSEITKQVLTLATAIVALTITFVKDFAPNPSANAKTVLAISWVLYLVSILAGFLTLMASAGLQQEAASKNQTPDINTGTLRRFGGLQLIAFLCAIILTVIAGIMAL